MSQAFIGEIRMFGGNFNPVGWVFCNGQLLPISQYDAVFALIGTTYGGDGVTTFAVPDLRGRVPMHQGSSHVLGQQAGVESVALTAATLPAHTHALGSSVAGSTLSPATDAPATATQNVYGAAPGVATPMAAGIVGASSGTGGAHENIQPYLAVSFIFCVEGIFPSRG
jgi:microcystin-dependent protein